MEETISDRIAEIAKAIEEEFGVPYEFIHKLLTIELDRVHQTQRHGIVSEITKMLEEDYWARDARKRIAG